MRNRAKGVLALFLLLAGFPLIDALPQKLGAIRVAGLSLLWWYGGVAAPLAAWIVAVAWLFGARPGSPAESE